MWRCLGNSGSKRRVLSIRHTRCDLPSIGRGDVSLDEITLTLNAFNQLSDAGKAIVGQENFDPNDLSAADKAIYDSITPADEQ